MVYQITCIAGEAVPHQCLIDGPLDIGRDPHCDIRLLDDRSSRYHARLEPQQQGLLLTDNRSSNGTWIGGQRIEAQQLTDGTMFTIGGTAFIIADLQKGANDTRIVTDDGVALDITKTEATAVWHSGDDPTALRDIHTALQALTRAEAGERGLELARQAAQLVAASQAAVVRGGRVQSCTTTKMSNKLAKRLAGGNDARLLVLGRDLIGRTVAAEAIGSAASAPLGGGHLLVARGVDADPLSDADLHRLAQLAAEAQPWFASLDEASIGLIGDSPLMNQLRERIRRIAKADASVLITGESGTGKEEVARSLHRLSGRSEGPFVAINCAAMAESLVEAELFGHEKGAFTGADQARPGRFRQAHGGMLFLDEIGEMPLALQAKLLRALQEGQVEPVGSNTTIDVDVRVIAATNRDLQAEVDAGRFRADLFYRLDVIRIHTPALRDHLDDISGIAQHLLARAAADTGIALPSIDPGFFSALQELDWPGNVRQLENVLTRALVLADGRLQARHLQMTNHSAQAAKATASSAAADQAEEDFPTLAEVEARHVLEALNHTGWNKSQAARLLGISRPTLHKKIADYGLTAPA